MPLAKLTLSIQKETIELAKEYARENGSSLSAMVEDYLRALTIVHKKEAEDLSPIVKSLSGILPLEEDFDYKKFMAEALLEKYSK